MSNFLQNLVRRGAGLPLSPGYLPKPASEADTPFGSMQGPFGLTHEESAQNPTEAPGAIQLQSSELQSSDAISLHSTPQIQRSSAVAAKTPSPPVDQLSATVFQPGSVEQQPISRQKIIAAEREAKRARTDETPVGPDQQIEYANNVEHGTHTVAQTVKSVNQLSSDRSNPVRTTSVEKRTFVLPSETSPHSMLGEGHLTRELPETDQMIRPAVIEPRLPLQFPRITPALQQSPATLPIHVRIGRVEVRGAPPQEPARSTPKESAPLGFDSYQRMRRYRN